jgi:hypothetical protein
MQYVCDGVGSRTWFRLESATEAASESRDMSHAVEKFFTEAHDRATKSYVPPATARVFEQNIGLKAHVQKSMPLFLTLRNNEGKALVTAMLPPSGRDDKAFRPIIVGPDNADPYVEHAEDIRKLGQHYKLTLDPVRCFPYRRG